MISLDPEAQCVAEANRAAHWDLSNKANANNYALIFIYVYTVIYVCVNGGGYQLFSSAALDLDCIIYKIDEQTCTGFSRFILMGSALGLCLYA